MKSLFYTMTLLTVFIIGIISCFAMYSTDGGQFNYHTKNHAIRFCLFFTIMINDIQRILQ